MTLNHTVRLEWANSKVSPTPLTKAFSPVDELQAQPASVHQNAVAFSGTDTPREKLENIQMLKSMRWYERSCNCTQWAVKRHSVFEGFRAHFWLESFLEASRKQWYLGCLLKEGQNPLGINGGRTETQADDRGNHVSTRTCPWSSETGWICPWSNMSKVRLSLHWNRSQTLSVSDYSQYAYTDRLSMEEPS